jgi:hypothetical protein
MTSNRRAIVISVAVLVIIVAGIWYFLLQGNAMSGNMASSTSMTASSTATSTVKVGAIKSTTAVLTTYHTPVSTTPTPVTTATPPPTIISFAPSAGSPGTTVTINGTNFDPTTNYITFGATADRHHTDGTPDNQIATVASSNGTSLSFTVPSSGPSGVLCDAGNNCVAISSVLLSPGNYPVTVRTKSGTSNTELFVLVK